MRSLTVVINDHFSGARASLLFSESDFVAMEVNWDAGDRLLRDLQGVAPFVGYERWSDLTPTHYRVLVMKNLQLLDGVSDEQRNDMADPVSASLQFLLVAMAKCLSVRSESMVEMIRIHRMAEYDVTYEFFATLNLGLGDNEEEGEVEETPTPFKIVVDNSQ